MVIRKKSVASKTPPKSTVPGWTWMLMGSMLTLVIGASLYLWQPFNKSKPTVVSEVKSATEKNSHTDGTSKSDLSSVKDSKKEYEFYDVLPEQESTPIVDDIVVIQPTEPQQPLENKVDVVLQQKAEPIVADDTLSVSQESDSKTTSQAPATSNTPDTVSAHTTPTASVATVVTSDDEKKSHSSTHNTEVNTAVTKSDPVTDPIAELIAKEKTTTYILQINSFGNSEEADKRRAQVLMAGVESRVVKTGLGGGGYLYQVLSNVYKNRDDVFLAQKHLQDSGIDTIVVERKPEG